MSALVWQSQRYGLAHAVPPGRRMALCGRSPSVRSEGWQPSPDKARCAKCREFAALPPDVLAGRIAAMPEPKQAGPRERYLIERGLLP